MKYHNSLSAFETFILVGPYGPHKVNPARRAADLLAGRDARRWALRFLAGANGLTREEETAVQKWAAIEALNTSSVQKAMLPARLLPFLRGSGRWHAGDRGGWSALLREAAIEYQRLSPEDREAYGILGCFITHDQVYTLTKMHPPAINRAGWRATLSHLGNGSRCEIEISSGPSMKQWSLVLYYENAPTAPDCAEAMPQELAEELLSHEIIVSPEGLAYRGIETNGKGEEN